MAELTETTVERSRWTSKSSSKTKALKHDPPWQSQCQPLGIEDFFNSQNGYITKYHPASASFIFTLPPPGVPVAIDQTFHRH